MTGWQALGIETPDGAQLLRIAVRLFAALLLCGIIGLQRELTGKAAGLRTHMLVGVGTAFFVISSLESGMAAGDLSRVVQGLAAGIGFIGGGAILKLSVEHRVKGLTTAASLWVTAAIGVAAGLGQIVPALMAALLTWFVLAVVGWLESRLRGHTIKSIDD